MGWATAAIERLRQGQTVTVRPRGHSVAGKVDDGDTVTVEPVGERELRAGRSRVALSTLGAVAAH